MTSQALEYLLGRAGLIEDRVRALVQERRKEDPAPDDPFRGLYLSDDAVDRLLHVSPGSAPTGDAVRRAELDRTADAAVASGVRVPLRDLERAAGLSDLDSDLLVIALLPDLDSRFERLFGYLNDDVTRRRATIGLAFELAGEHAASVVARSRLGPGSPLREQALVIVEDLDRPFLTRGLRVPDRVAGHLLGDDSVDAALTPVTASWVAYQAPAAERIAAAVDSGSGLVYLRDDKTRTGVSVAVATLALLDRGVVGLDLSRLAQEPDHERLVAVAAREALLRGGGIVAQPVEALSTAAPQSLRRLCALPVPVLLVGTTTWDPRWALDVPLVIDAPTLTTHERTRLWQRELEGMGSDVDPAEVTAHFVLGPEETSRAVKGAQAAARLDGQALSADHLRLGARSQNAAGLETLSTRIQPEVSWDDLVLPTTVHGQLRDLAARARHRDLVLNEWRMRPGGGRGRGLTALFAGDSGTGKTMSAEVIARELGLDLYAVNLATVVDKYVGETEKNLERIFHEAGGVNAVLLFDEADAIFGKRSEVKDAHDRYANIESAYLLQRMESFDGLAILSTNLRANIDEAFTRRLDAIVDFPRPDEKLRAELWQRCLAPPLPVADDIDVAFCAHAFELSGGNIRSVAITAAYLAAAQGEPVTMAAIVLAVHQEYRKLGRLVVEHEFGPYLSSLR